MLHSNALKLTVNTGSRHVKSSRPMVMVMTTCMEVVNSVYILCIHGTCFSTEVKEIFNVGYIRNYFKSKCL